MKNKLTILLPFIVVYLTILLLAGCMSDADRKKAEYEHISKDHDVINTLHYYRDTHTNLCFAVNENFREYNGVMTNVPCTPEVVAMIK